MPNPISQQDILSSIHNDPRLSALWTGAQAHCGTDPAHDLGHMLRVARWACHIMVLESAVHPDLPQAIAAAMLHDMVNLPKNHPDRALASQRSAEKAFALFVEAGFCPTDSQIMADAIRTHSFSRSEAPVTLLGKALQDADRLDTLGVIGIFRCIAVTTQMQGNFFDLNDPWASDRALDDTRFTIDHVLTKLVQLPRLMHTATGREEATARLEKLYLLMRQLGDEIGAGPPPAKAWPIA